MSSFRGLHWCSGFGSMSESVTLSQRPMFDLTFCLYPSWVRHLSGISMYPSSRNCPPELRDGVEGARHSTLDLMNPKLDKP